MSFKTLQLKSTSKINLGLWIKEKRQDGFHEVETIYYENEDLFDTIGIKYEENDDLLIDVSFVQNDLNKSIPSTKNLVYKAASIFFEKLRLCGKCQIVINKNTPLNAGLGGGSSNAACVLKGLNYIFGNKLDLYDLLYLSGQVGSDVPFFIIGKACIGKGRGEILTPIENKLKLTVKIVKPNDISISTKWAYEQIGKQNTRDRAQQMNNLIFAMKNADYDLFYNNLFNDFEEVIFSFYPQLIDLKKQLLKEGYRACHLCGSGSALFGIK